MTKLLLDTCTLITWASDPLRIREHARSAIADPTSIVYVSSISAVEIAIKRQLGKLASPTDVAGLLADASFCELPITIAHAKAINRFPLIHRDPFDRLLIAQAHAEKLTLVTSDRLILQYDVACLAA